MFFGTKTWTSEQLAEEFTAAGFQSGQNVILHSSLRSVGKTEAGAKTVTDALLSVIGPSGNLLVPTFTYSLPGWKGDPFDLQKSPARTGAIPEHIRNRRDALRSFHPTHSTAVIGPEAEEICRDHFKATPLGVESPFSKMLDRNATILMLGTHQDTNSSLHLCEVMAELPYICVCFSENTDFEIAWYHNDKGEVEFTPIREVPGCSRGFRAIEPALEGIGVLSRIYIGDAECQILSLRKLIDETIEILHKDPCLLLCHLDHCGICPKRRAYMKQHSLR